jgi:hypothetical protein
MTFLNATLNEREEPKVTHVMQSVCSLTMLDERSRSTEHKVASVPPA